MEVYTTCANVTNDAVASARGAYKLLANNLKADNQTVLSIPDPASRKRSYTDPGGSIALANHGQTSRNITNHFSHAALIALPPRQKIPRPPNAFMLFANEWRKKLAIQFPRESNKDISVRLGGMWKNMAKEEKDGYFGLARKVDAEHKKKYPDYVYNPKEARMRKALREQSRENRNQLSRAQAQTGMTAGGRGGAAQSQQWMKGHQGFIAPGHAGARPGRHPGLMSPKMMGDQRTVEEMRNKIREQVEHGIIQGYTETLMDIETIPYHQLTGQMGLQSSGDYAVVSEMDGQWYPFSQGTQHGTPTYMMRHGDDKLQTGTPWNVHYQTDNRTSQAPAYMMRHHMMGSNGSYGNSIGSQGVQSSMNQPSPRPNVVQQQQSYAGIYQQQATVNNQQAPNINPKREENREERMRMLDLMPTTSSTQTTTNTTTQKTPTTPSSTTQSCTTTVLSNSSKNMGTEVLTDSITSDSQVNPTENSNANRPLPAFEQAFGSTEIGRYSHEGFFNNNQQTPSNTGTQTPEPKPTTVPSTESSETTRNPSLMSPPCGDYQPGIPSYILSPTGKMDSSDSLLSPPSWPSMYYYSPGGGCEDSMLACSEAASKHGLPGDYGCYNSPHFSHMPYATYFDYALLSGAEYMSGGPDDAVLLDTPGFGDGSDLQVAFDGGGSTILAPGNTFRDAQDGLDYVTLHIPASTLANSSSSSSHSPMFENRNQLLLNRTDSQNDKGGETMRKYMKLEKMSGDNVFLPTSKEIGTVKSQTTNSEQDLCLKKENIDNEGRTDDLKRQNLTITGMAMREPIVISQNERICVLMDTPEPITANGKEFTSL